MTTGVEVVVVQAAAAVVRDAAGRWRCGWCAGDGL